MNLKDYMHISSQDQDLLVGCKSNDRKSQEILYRKYFPVVESMCRRYTTDEEIIISIINDGFLKVFKNISKYNELGSFEGWVKRIVFHALSDHFKKENKKQKFVELQSYDHSEDAKSLNDLYLEDLNLVINQLTPATKEVFILYAVDGFTHSEISEKLNIAIGTSKWHLSKAREELQKLLHKNQNNLHHGS